MPFLLFGIDAKNSKDDYSDAWKNTAHAKTFSPRKKLATVESCLGGLNFLQIN
jgi:hypothetical protein